MSDVFGSGHLYVNAAQDDNVAIVEIKFIADDGQEVSAAGSSKRAQGDKRNRSFGYHLAMARALALLSEKVLELEGFFFEEE
jgi:hypothetical protein